MSLALDAEVAEALERAGLRVRGWLEVTTIPFPPVRRATYRIDLESGETIKARCLLDESSARRLFEIRRGLPDGFVPAFHHHGRVLLERWVHGEILGPAAPDDARLVEAAVLLGRLHATTMAAEPVGPDDSTHAWRLKTERGLRTLVEARAVEAQEAAQLGRALARADPGRAAAGLGHFDFCGENMVVDHSGQLRVFDNERVGVGPIGFDLARAWYRWGLPAKAWLVFTRAYAATSVVDAPLAHIDFWRVVVLVQSACLRLRVEGSRVSVPIDKLRSLAAANGGAAR